MIPESASAFPGSLRDRQKKIALAVLTAALLLCRWPLGLLLAALLLLIPLLYLLFRLVDGDAKPVMLLWVGIFPLGYYFLSFPRSQPIISFDRLMVLLLAAGIALCPRDQRMRIPDVLRRCAWAWVAFLAAALLSLVTITPIRSPLRMWLDVFVLPAVLAWYLVTCFPVRSCLRPLHGIICLVSIYSAAIGAAEIVLGRDLLPLPGAGDYTASLFLRGNGPYSSNNSFGLIGLLTFCLLWFLRLSLNKELPRWQRILHQLGMTAALLQAIMPLFRSIEITLALILFLDLFRNLTRLQKAVRVGGLALLGVMVLIISVTLPGLFADRINNSESIYARVAQQKQNFLLFQQHPIFGVGLNNFNQVASTKHGFAAYYDGIEALDYPHSNLGGVLAETGLVGFIPFVLSQVLLIVCFWRLRGTPSGRLAWTFFVYIFLSYWITGLALTSGYYSDLNLYYMFCLAVIYKYAVCPHVEKEENGRRS